MLKMFKEERVIPGAAIVCTEFIAFNVDENSVDYAVAILVDSIRTGVYLETDEMIEIME